MPPIFIFKKFPDLTLDELYALLELRQLVFVTEQKCAYTDADYKDQNAWHLLGYDGEKLAVYARITFPGVRYEEISIGRVVSAPEYRRTGWGRAVMKMALENIETMHGKVPVRISAQTYLMKFYQSFGFEIVSEEYMEDGLPHREMLRRG